MYSLTYSYLTTILQMIQLEAYVREWRVKSTTPPPSNSTADGSQAARDATSSEFQQEEGSVDQSYAEERSSKQGDDSGAGGFERYPNESVKAFLMISQEPQTTAHIFELLSPLHRIGQASMVQASFMTAEELKALAERSDDNQDPATHILPTQSMPSPFSSRDFSTPYSNITTHPLSTSMAQLGSRPTSVRGDSAFSPRRRSGSFKSRRSIFSNRSEPLVYRPSLTGFQANHLAFTPPKECLPNSYHYLLNSFYNKERISSLAVDTDNMDNSLKLQQQHQQQHVSKYWGLRLRDIKLLWTLNIRDSLFAIGLKYFELFVSQNTLNEDSKSILKNPGNNSTSNPLLGGKGSDENKATMMDFLDMKRKSFDNRKHIKEPNKDMEAIRGFKLPKEDSSLLNSLSVLKNDKLDVASSHSYQHHSLDKSNRRKLSFGDTSQPSPSDSTESSSKRSSFGRSCLHRSNSLLHRSLDHSTRKSSLLQHQASVCFQADSEDESDSLSPTSLSARSNSMRKRTSSNEDCAFSTAKESTNTSKSNKPRPASMAVFSSRQSSPFTIDKSNSADIINLQTSFDFQDDENISSSSNKNRKLPLPIDNDVPSPTTNNAATDDDDMENYFVLELINPQVRHLSYSTY